MNSTPVSIADLDGDGLDDVIGFHSTGIWVRYARAGRTWSGCSILPVATGSTGVTYIHNTSWTSMDVYPRYMGDYNGDGKADIYGFA